ncbi:hypothetical protein [Terriglobus sp. RCC_193]|uniref:hypothetical protein n=1 Tax=Terriglobus sp. RCC_193 TaxID=3239218 RepID=UPI0035259BEF
MTITARLLLFGCVAAFSVPVAAQSNSNPANATGNPGTAYNPANPANSGLPRSTVDENGLDLDPAVVHRRDEVRKLERKKRMVDNANRLLALTQQLRADLQGREATPEDQKRLDEIARLARQVKDQMRN